MFAFLKWQKWSRQTVFLNNHVKKINNSKKMSRKIILKNKLFRRTDVKAREICSLDFWIFSVISELLQFSVVSIRDAKHFTNRESGQRHFY